MMVLSEVRAREWREIKNTNQNNRKERNSNPNKTQRTLCDPMYIHKAVGSVPAARAEETPNWRRRWGGGRAVPRSGGQSLDQGGQAEHQVASDMGGSVPAGMGCALEWEQ